MFVYLVKLLRSRGISFSIFSCFKKLLPLNFLIIINFSIKESTSKKDIISFQKYSSFLKLRVVYRKTDVSLSSSQRVFFPGKLVSEV